MRSLARWGTLSLLAAPLGAWALSLGEIDVRSALNQPFAAEIELSGTAEELQSLNISLASPETFARYGLDRPAVLGSFDFRVGTNASGRSVIIVTSSQSIGEPFIELLVEASSRSGRFLHQYTVFLDPPTFLSETTAPAPIQPPETRTPEPSVAGGAIPRTTPRPAAPSAAPPPVTPAQAPAPSRAPAPDVGIGGSYGPVQNGETLWGIASQMGADGISINQMMVAIYEANPQAFDANMNVLRRGAILRIPERAELERVGAGAATATVQQHTDTWQGRAAQAPRLVLVPPSSEAESGPAGARTSESTAPAASDGEVAELRDQVVALQTELEESRRLLELRNEELLALQERLSAESGAETEPEAAPRDPGLESEPLFADEVPIAVDEPAAPAADEPVAETERVAEAETDAPAPTATPVPTPVTATPEPSLVDRILGWAATPIVWIAVGGIVVLLGLLLFLRRRSAVVEDVTGQWEALEAEVDEDAREATSRMRRQARDEDFLVHEQRAEADEVPEEVEPLPVVAAAPARGRPRAAGTAEGRARQAESEAVEATLSSQTVINLDQADPIAEADFHMAYGLYDQAADLVSKALEAKPDSRELKLKLLEVFFVWGNKDSFLKTAQGLRKEMGARPDADWDKVIIMGKQICPDEALFAAATAAAGEVDVDLEAGDAPALDLAFDAEESAGGDDVDLDLGLGGSDVDLDFAATSEEAQVRPKKGDDDFALDIGERTQAGLEEALAELDEQASATTPDIDVDSLAATQESPTVETPRSKGKNDDWGVITMESPTVEASGPETATVERPSFEDDDLVTVETPTIESTFGMRGQASEDEGTSASGEYTAELNLDDLGLDVTDIESLPHDLGDLPTAQEAESDTREQPRVGVDSDLLSATGVTQVLEDAELEHLNTAVLGDDDATMMAPGFEGDRLSSTEVLEHSDEESADEDALDLNLDDFSAALRGSDTVEQPRTASFERGVFAGGDTPIDIDVGADVRGDDEPTGTEEVDPMDPQTMTEVGTKLDLARAYIDMGDPEGARSILEEVLDEGDAGQRREAQSLINALPA